MGAESGLKAWVQKHSPVKSRNKPLPPPPPPEADSPIRKPMREVSGNEASGKTPSRLRAFLNKKLPSQPPSPAKHEYTKPTVPAETLHRSPIRRSLRNRSHKGPDVAHLTTKVTVLEAQLQAARRELEKAAGKRSNQGHRSVSDEINRAIEEKQRSLGRGDRYNGVVESLLGKRSYSKRSFSEPPQLDWAYADYLAAEDAYEPTVAAIETPTSWRQDRSVPRDIVFAAELSRSKRGRYEQTAERSSMDRPARRQKVLHDENRADDSHQIKVVGPEFTLTRSSSESERPRLQRQRASIEDAHRRDDLTTRQVTGIESPNMTSSANYEIEPISEEEEPAGAEQMVARKLRCVSPSKLQTVDEEFEWNDEEIF